MSFKLLGPPVQMGFGYPDVNFHFYYLNYTFDKSEFPAFEIREILINGIEVRDFEISDDGDS
ncbi:hypothetical protein ACFL4T_07215, partial [candidate division KSB1 bacterium]